MIVTAELQTYQRRAFKVKAIRITRENINEIAKWTGSEVHYTYGSNGDFLVIHVPTGKVSGRVFKTTAYIGDWVTCLADSPDFRVYRDKSFLQTFQAVLDETEKYVKVHELLLKVARAQDSATYHGNSSGDVILLIEQTAHEICALI